MHITLRNRDPYIKTEQLRVFIVAYSPIVSKINLCIYSQGLCIPYFMYIASGGEIELLIAQNA